jgi:glycosyltransferase involved in cell wall biosynthesis
VVSISETQRKSLPVPARWIATVPHGLPGDLYSFSPGSDDGYLAFLGRISPEKRPDRAIEIARRADVHLKIAAKVDRVDVEYFNKAIRPLLKLPGIDYVGEINDRDKQAFLAGAMALLFPIDWPEPFGLVQIEAMACGTPVIAWRSGSVPEVVDHGVTGFIVETVEEAVAAVKTVRSLDRKAVRKKFESRFSVERAAHNYVRVYESFGAQETRWVTTGPATPTSAEAMRTTPKGYRINHKGVAGVLKAAGLSEGGRAKPNSPCGRD